MGTRFDFSDSEDCEHELMLNGQPYLTEKVGLVEGALSELIHEHRLVVMEEVRKQISTLEADLADKINKFTFAIVGVEKHSEARREIEKSLDLQYQRAVAEDLDDYLTGVQRRHQHRSQIEERRIRDDAVIERRREEKIKAKQEMQARLEAENKRAQQVKALESQRAAAHKLARLLINHSFHSYIYRKCLFKLQVVV